MPKTKPNKTKLTLVQSPLTTSGQEMDWVYFSKKHISWSLHRAHSRADLDVCV